MEYVVLKAVRPTWLNLQLPTEVAALIRYAPNETRGLRAPGRGIVFLARGPGIVRVVAAHRAGDVLGIETLHNRFIAPAHLTEKLVFNLPEAVEEHLRLKIQRRGELAQVHRRRAHLVRAGARVLRVPRSRVD